MITVRRDPEQKGVEIVRDLSRRKNGKKVDACWEKGKSYFFFF